MLVQNLRGDTGQRLRGNIRIEKVVKDVTFIIIEDDEVDAMQLRRVFRQLEVSGKKVFAKDGAEGLELLRGHNGREKVKKPFIILLDLNMPRMGGLEFLDELRTDTELRNSIVFVLTTSNDRNDRTLAYEKHVSGYIVKTDPNEGIINAVSMIDSYRQIVSFP